MVEDQLTLKLYGFVISSSYRKMVLLELSKSPQIPTNIARRLNINVNHVSRALSQLNSKGLVQCINPEERKGRVYILTELGRKVLNRLSAGE